MILIQVKTFTEEMLKFFKLFKYLSLDFLMNTLNLQLNTHLYSAFN